jgi:hypothetical protein
VKFIPNKCNVKEIINVKSKNLFRDYKERDAVLKLIYEDYVIKDMTAPELAEKYGYSKRQIRYIIEKYLLAKKGRGKRKIMKEEKPETFMYKGKKCRKATLNDLLLKLDLYKNNLKDIPEFDYDEDNDTDNTIVENN